MKLRNYALVTAGYWAFTLTDGALRMLVLLYFHELGYSPVLLAFLFHLEEPAGELWQQYDRLYHEVNLRIDDAYPRSWGDWFFPMQTFMGFVEAALIETNPTWANLFISEAVRELLDIEPAVDTNIRTDVIELDSIFVSDAQVDQVTLLSEYLTACAERIGHIDPRGYPGGNDPSVPLTDVYIPLRLIPLAAQVVDHEAELRRGLGVGLGQRHGARRAGIVAAGCFA